MSNVADTLERCCCIVCGVYVMRPSRTLERWAVSVVDPGVGICADCAEALCHQAQARAIEDHLTQRRAYTPEQEIEAAR